MLAILDYGIGNVRSVLNAFEFIGQSATLTRDRKELSHAAGLVIPGVGAFGEGMRRLTAYQLLPEIEIFVKTGRPVLGICLGFQLLMESSDEHGMHKGLGFLPLPVRRLKTAARLPHFGWAPVTVDDVGHHPMKLMQGVDGESFYFVHSYGVCGRHENLASASAEYGGTWLMAGVESGNIYGVQFHPEKSGDAGLQLLKNFKVLSS